MSKLLRNGFVFHTYVLEHGVVHCLIFFFQLHYAVVAMKILCN